MKFTLAYTFLFAYVIAAIVFWGYSLNKLSRQIYSLEKEVLSLKQSAHTTLSQHETLKALQERRVRRTKQYWGEGSTFVLIILFMAGIVYYAYYRQRTLARLQRNFMLSVTHELKTPIAGIKLNMQTLEKRQLDPETRQKLMTSAVNETNRLNDLCNNILASTQLESTYHALYNDTVMIKNLIGDIVKQMKERYPGLMVHTRFPEQEVAVKGDQALWRLMLSNLLENARKYSPDNEPIQVGLHAKGKQYILEIADRGPGIPDEEKEKIFDKFYRVGNENTRRYSGTGLGLYIVKRIVRLYKYQIRVKDNPGQGTLFEILFH